jgi:tetratricopeptide (TPR) repeat protein
LATQEWFRKTTWSESDRTDFFARLARSRGSYHKAQYCRIQAHHLYETKKLELVEAAFDLLQMIRNEWPEEQMAPTWSQIGDCYEFLEKRELALAAYQEVFKVQRERKGTRTTAHLTFAWIVATEGMRNLYDEALQVLDEFAMPIEFPVDKYKSNVARAFISDDRGNRDMARQYAALALDGMEMKTSGLQYHKSVGLVSIPEKDVVRRLCSLVET